jgi:hypothetical protein
MESYYEINVALNGVHFFATAPRSIKTEQELISKLRIFKEKFHKDEGYELIVTYWDCIGHQIDTANI